MVKDICLCSIMNDYIIAKSKDEDFNVSEKDYIQDINKLAELCNKNISTFSFESKKDIYKVLMMVDLSNREFILKSFLDYYLSKYDLQNDYNDFFTKEIIIIPLRNHIKKLLKTEKINSFINEILNLNSCNDFIKNRLKNWINIEYSLINLNMDRTSKLKEYKNEFYFDIIENYPIQRYLCINDLNNLLDKFNLQKQAKDLLKKYNN